MADMTQSTTSSGPRNAEAGAITRFLRATEIDTRLLGMIGALLIIWIGFDLYLRIFDGREFLTATKPLEPFGADLRNRGPGDRHGAGHRHAQHRPFGRLAARLRRA